MFDTKRVFAFLTAFIGVFTVAVLGLAGPAGADPTPYPSGSSSSSGGGSGTGGGDSYVTGGSLTAGGTFTRGEQLTITVHLPDGEKADLKIYSKVYDLGTVTGGSDNTATFSFRIPSDISYGEHHAIVTNLTEGVQIADIPFTVASSTGSGTGSGSSGSGGGTASTGVAVGVIGGVGLLLIAGGVAFLMAGRRRSHA